MNNGEHSKLPRTENHFKIPMVSKRKISQSLVIGFSCRALAQSVSRAGLEPWVIDCCGDLDTLECSAHYQKIDALDDQKSIGECVERWGSKADFDCVFFAGGMENQDLSPNLPSAGINESPLARLRSWRAWESWAREVGMEFPKTMDLESEAARAITNKIQSAYEPDRTWLIKDLSQAGGLGVRLCENGLAEKDLLNRDSDRRLRILQQYVDGDSVGVSFLSGRKGGVALGAVRALPHAQHPWSDFIYRGSMGPIPLTEQEWLILDSFANCVTLQSGWSGVWNADFIRASDGWYLLEINPRWSAGMELLDQKWRRSIAWHHANVVGDNGNPLSWIAQKNIIEEDRSKKAAPIRKEILYLDRSWSCTEQAVASMWERRWGSAESSLPPWSFADIPPAKTELEAGYPFCSLFTIVGEQEQGDEWSMKAKDWLRLEFQVPIAP